MTATGGDKGSKTVVLAADVGGYSITMVNLAVQLAASVDTRLHGLFIEDEDLLQVTGLPCAREIMLTTASERPADVQRMQRLLRMVSEQFRRTLEQEARALKITWSFDYVRGRLHEIGLRPVADATYTILGKPAAHRLRTESTRRRRRILLIPNRARHQLHALEVVLAGFARDGAEVVVVSGADDEEFRQGIENLVRRSGSGNELVEFDRTELAGLLSRLGSRFDCAILSQHESAGDLAQILRGLQCPVILAA